MIASKGLIKGMHQDNNPRYQPPNTYHSALNAVVESTDGDLMSISNELGNLQELTTYPLNDDGIPKKIIGHRLLDDGTTVLFLFDPLSERPDHEIGIWDPKQKKYTTYVYGTCLNFSDKHYVNAVYRLKNGCERVVYFTDNYNPYRVINLDRPEYYTAPPSTSLLSCDKLKYSRDYLLPDFAATVLTSGGVLKVGTYSFAYRLLDDDNNPTDWIFFTNPISLSDDNEDILADPETVNSYDGGVSNKDETGFVADTVKSIELTITNIDTRFKNYQIAVIKKLASDGSVSGVDFLIPEPILAEYLPITEVKFIYTGQLSQIETPASVEELFAEKLHVDQVTTHTVQDNRLFIANLSNTQKNLTGLQRHASSIRVEYVEAPIDVAEALSKDPNYYFSEAGFLHDEVYALGIVYVFDDGTVSPVFHIPGRDKINNNAGLYGTNPFNTDYSGSWDDADVTGDVNIINPDKTERWQVYNTFTEFDSPHTSGLLGYYQTDTVYPDIEDCSGHPDGYWGLNWQFNQISPGDPIRHHRMPPSLRTVANEPSYIRKLGLRFEIEQEYPTHENISGHYFVYSDRTHEKTILDRGMLVPIGGNKIRKTDSPPPLAYGYTSASDDYHLPSSSGILVGVPRQDHPLYGFISPSTLFEQRMASGNYLAVDRYHDSPTIFSTDTTYSYYTPNFDNIIWSYSVRVHQHEAWTLPLEINFKIKFSELLPKSQVGYGENDVTSTLSVPFGFITNLANLSVSTDLGVVVLDRELAEIAAYPLSAPDGGSPIGENKFFKDGNGYTASIKADVYVFRNLETIEYKRIGNTQLHKEENVLFSATLFDGDIFICPLDVVDFHWFVDAGDANKTKIKASFVTTPIESTINTGLRHGDTKNNNEFAYFKWNNLDDTEFFHRYVTSKYFTPAPDNPTVFQFYPESHLYSYAFSYLDPIYSYRPLTSDYDYCTDCISKFPYRIYYSKLDDIERRMDAFREILPNNYTDIDGTNGPITDMFVNFNQLYLTTPFATYKIPTNLQVLSTEDSESVYVGSGNVFSIPPKPLKTADGAFAGQRLWKSRVQTEYGTFFMDTDSFRPILFSDQLQDVSLNGLRNFFQNNAKLKFLDQFKLLTGQDYTNVSTVSPYGVGYISVYDPRHKRIIVHKKDYTIRPEFAQSFQVIPYEETQSEEFEAPQTLWFDGDQFFYETSPVHLSNSFWFDNRSFTLSYSFLNNAWTSFHSYFPYYTFSDNSTFYTDNIYTHHVGDYQTFYGAKHDHFLDIIIPLDPNEIKTFASLNYVADTWEYSPTYEAFTKTDHTFDKAVFYNSTQSSGYNYIIANPTPFQSITIPNISAKRTDSKWKINDPRDYTTSNFFPIWDNAPQIFSPETWTNREPNQGIIQYSKSLFDLPRFKDYYQGVRLHFKPSVNLKVTTDLIQTLYTNKTR